MSNSWYYARLLLNYTLKTPCLWNATYNARRLCGKAPGIWESYKREEGTRKMCLNAQIQNSFQHSPTLLTLSTEMRVSVPRTSLPVENADSGHTSTFPCSSGLVCILAGAPPPHRYCTQTLCHRPLAPEIPRSDNELLLGVPAFFLSVSDYFR